MNRPYEPSQFYREALEGNGISVAFGVPDSTLNGLLNYFAKTKSKSEHIVMASEGGAIALAAGYYLSTQKIALAYLQNSGYSNALNPLQSLAAKEVFGIPMLLMIGWRGKPGIKDEPQHALIGPKLLENLRANEFPYEELPDTVSEAKHSIARLISIALKRKTPVAIIVPPASFQEYKHDARLEIPPAVPTDHATMQRWTVNASTLALSRETAIRTILACMHKIDVTVCSLGGNTRELYMIRKEKNQPISNQFLCIGSMGHAFALAHGVAMAFPSRRVFCIDGDGSFLMHVGNNAVLAGVSDRNVVHIVIYNGVYSSTGEQPLMLSREHFLALAAGLPYKQKIFVDREDMLERACQVAEGGTIIVVAVNNSVSKKLPRPSETPEVLKTTFMKSLL